MGFLLFLFPFAEFYTYYQFVEAYSFLDAVLYTISSMALGVLLMSLNGRAVIFDIQKSVTKRQLPTTRLMHRAVLMLGGLLIFIPGILSDILGALCLLPGSRHLIVAYAKVAFANALAKGSVRFFGAGMGPAGAGGFSSAQFQNQWPPQPPEERDAQIVDVTPISITHKTEKPDDE